MFPIESAVSGFRGEQRPQGGSLPCYFNEKHILKLFTLSSCQYVSTIPKKTACYRPVKNRHFVGVCTEKMMDRHYRENGARNMYPNYNQMRAYVECSPNQSKKIIPLQLFHRAIHETLRILE